tara:strand:+ start:290 stop:751 length:462 start_codon:yes stop_codon:yes gene_type:complete
VVEQDLQDVVHREIPHQQVHLKVTLEVMELQGQTVVELAVAVEEQLLQDQMERFQDQHPLLIWEDVVELEGQTLLQVQMYHTLVVEVDLEDIHQVQELTCLREHQEELEVEELEEQQGLVLQDQAQVQQEQQTLVAEVVVAVIMVLLEMADQV